MKIIERYEELHPASKRLHERALRHFPDGITHDIRYFTPFPLYVERSDGAYKWDADGNEIIDFINGHGALLLGHNYPAVKEAVADLQDEMIEDANECAQVKQELLDAKTVEAVEVATAKARILCN